MTTNGIKNQTGIIQFYKIIILEHGEVFQYLYKYEDRISAEKQFHEEKKNGSEVEMMAIYTDHQDIELFEEVDEHCISSFVGIR